MIYKNLIKSLIVILLLSSCSISFHGNLHKIEKRQLNPSEIKLIFNNDSNKILFKTQIDLYDNNFSGLLVVKSIKENNKKIVLVTELGIKIFEFEFRDDEFEVHYCLEMLNKKAILKTLEKDLRLILMNNMVSGKAKILKDENNLVYKLKKNKRNNYYYINTKADKLVVIESLSGIFKKVTIELKDYKDNYPEKINILHHNIKLNIKLKLIEI